MKTRWKDCPASEGKMKRLSSQWRQDEKVIWPVKARWKSFPASWDKMKKLSDQWRQDEKVVRPVKTRLIILKLLFVNSYGLQILGLDIYIPLYWSEISDYRQSDYNNQQSKRHFRMYNDILLLSLIRVSICLWGQKCDGVFHCSIMILYKPW